jgi:hypothetical protein
MHIIPFCEAYAAWRNCTDFVEAADAVLVSESGFRKSNFHRLEGEPTEPSDRAKGQCGCVSGALISILGSEFV